MPGLRTDAPLTMSILGALHHLRVASIREVAAHMDSDDAPTRDKVGTTLRRMQDAGLVEAGACATTETKRVENLWVLTPEGESKRLDLVRRLSGLPREQHANTNGKGRATAHTAALGAGSADSAPQR